MNINFISKKIFFDIKIKFVQKIFFVAKIMLANVKFVVVNETNVLIDFVKTQTLGMINRFNNFIYICLYKQ